MPSWRHIKFEGQHVDEKILHYAGPSNIQTTIEILKMVAVFCIIIFVVLGLWGLGAYGTSFMIVLIITCLVFMSIPILYKLYRAKRNFLYITSKRVLFHGMEGLFKDYVKKITYENIRNVNYSTDSLWGKIFGYGTLSIQSSHGGEGDITVYHVEYGKMLTHYLDKIISLSQEERNNFNEFDSSYFRNWKS